MFEFVRPGEQLSWLWWRHAIRMNNGMTQDLYRFDQVHIRRAQRIGNPWYYTAVASMMGVAVVWSDDTLEVTLIGRTSNIDRFLAFYPTAETTRQDNQTAAGLGLMRKALETHTPTIGKSVLEIKEEPTAHGRLGPYYVRAYDLWLSKLKLQHKAAEVCHELRDWSPQPPGSPEVVLLPHHGGHRLGGAVWPWTMYFTEEGTKFLGIGGLQSDG